MAYRRIYVFWADESCLVAWQICPRYVEQADMISVLLTFIKKPEESDGKICE